MRIRTAGLCCLCIGIGMILTMIMPIFSWICIVAVGMIFIGWKCLTKH